MVTLFTSAIVIDSVGTSINLGVFNINSESEFYTYIAKKVAIEDEIISSAHLYIDNKHVDILCSAEGSKKNFNYSSTTKAEKELERLVFEACEKHSQNESLLSLKRAFSFKHF